MGVRNGFLGVGNNDMGVRNINLLKLEIYSV
jgi:hypothetical protein